LRFPLAEAAVQPVTPGSEPRLFLDSCCARCIRATTGHTTSPVRVPCSPAQVAPALTQLVLESGSDRPVLSRCGASPDGATRDRSSLAEPRFAHPGDRLSFGYPQSVAHCAHARRSLRAHVGSIAGCPTGTASQFL